MLACFIRYSFLTEDYREQGPMGRGAAVFVRGPSVRPLTHFTAPTR